MKKAILTIEALSSVLPKNRKVLFFCVGTDRNTGDSLGPLVGSKLENKGYNVLGTIDDPVHGMNLKENIKLVRAKYKDYLIVAIDACLGRVKEDIGKNYLYSDPLYPGTSVGKNWLPPVGDFSIIGMVNVDAYPQIELNEKVLQDTPLTLVLKMADEIVKICTNTYPLQVVNGT